jgi:GT2 family glycosyltransferase
MKMEKITDEQLKREIAFDQYGRYAVMRDIINSNRGKEEKFRVLDVGGRGNIMRRFLPEDEVFYLDPLVDTKDENYIEGDGCDIPLKDGSFDWVVSADVFEHIPKGKREDFLRENIRVAGIGTILAAPFYSEETEKAEIEANENFKIFSGGRENQWLKEHIENGLPQKIEIENYLKKNGFSFQKIHNNSLKLWKHLIGIAFNISEPAFDLIRNKFFDFNYFYNSEVFPYDNAVPSYRSIYFIKKKPGLKDLEKKNKFPAELFIKSMEESLDFSNLVNFTYKNNLENNRLKIGELSDRLIKSLEESLDFSNLVNFTYKNNLENNRLKIGELSDRLKQKNDQILQLKETNRLREKDLFEIRTSLRWKIPNFVYKIYKNKLKKFIPRFFLDLARPVFIYLDKMGYGQFDGSSRFKLNLKNIEKLKFDSTAKLHFKKTANPKTSIVIPVYNKWRYTYSCLEALLENIKGAEYEVIVVDDCSSDETPEMMKKIENAVYVRNEKNLGFTGSCNAGAKKATGKYVVFLNNDTHILPGWLESLVETFEKNENVGLAGSKLVYPDGRLQEAGGIVWKNEHVWNYGRFKDPENFEFNYLKDVDYCSGASIMLPKKLFDELGGFDSRYAPGYFEDTDLAFKVRQAGFRTVYQPKSEVIHFEGVSNGKDLKKGVKRYQEVNKEKFFSRWKEVLEKENCADSEGPIFARDRSKGKKLMLFLDWNVPTFDKDAGSFVAFEYLKMLKSLDYKIIFWPHNQAKLEPYTETLQQMGIETVYGNVSFEKFMKEYGSQIDITLVSRPEVAKEHLDLVKQYSKGKVIYIAHDLHYLRMGREAEIGGNPEVKKKAEEMKALEESIMRKSDMTLFFSDKEVEIVKKEFPEIVADTMAWIQNMHIGKNFPGFTDREGIIFIGGFIHHPNIDSVTWFHDEIYPRVKDKIQNIKITIIGSNATPEIMALNDENFRIIGFVKEEDLPQLFGRNRIFAAPLRFGAGFKGKIAKAMSFGIPVVTTGIGSEGIGLLDGETALIADNAEEFAEKIVKLYSDRELWEKISKNSREHLKKNFSTEAAKEKFQAVLEEIGK